MSAGATEPMEPTGPISTLSTGRRATTSLAGGLAGLAGLKVSPAAVGGAAAVPVRGPGTIGGSSGIFD